MRRLSELYAGPQAELRERAGEMSDSGPAGEWFLIPGFRDYRGCRLRINILAMGDVGGTLALAMKLTGADVVSEIGICDLNETALARWEQELGQIALPKDPDHFPQIIPVSMEELFSCDAFVFCASAGVPDLKQTDVDVRMAQLEKNRAIIRGYAERAAAEGFAGEFFVVSDPVDPLCAAALGGGLVPQGVQGFGLGVMNGRAAYYARREERFADYLQDGRVFGPHGEDLVVANSLSHYDEEKALQLTGLTTGANIRIRQLGYKPYIAPAVTSGALSILENLRGEWHYSSAWFGPVPVPGESEGGPESAGGAGGAFLGMRCRRCRDGLLIEDRPLDERLFARIETAYRKLEEIG